MLYPDKSLKRKSADYRIKRFAILFLVVLIWLYPEKAYAFPVDELPEDNLIENPWFRVGGNDSGLDGWIDAGGTNKYWSSSQKASNPTPTQVIAGPCGSGELYCGTSARLDPIKGQSGGIGIPGVDAYLYQVVEADRSDRKLIFFAYWVSHEIEVAEVSIYGSLSPDGQWDLVWVPLFHTQDKLIKPSRGGGVEELWEETGFVEMVLGEGYPFYKVEIHARLPEGNATGFKITGVYLSTAQTDEPPSENMIVTQAPSDSSEPSTVEGTGESVEPTAMEESVEPIKPSVVEETNVNGGRATQSALRTQVELESQLPTTKITVVPPSSPTSPSVTILDTPANEVMEEPGGLNPDSGFSSGFLAGGLTVLLIVGSVFLARLLFKR